MLYVDLPDDLDLRSLMEHRDEMSVSVYLPTTPISREADASRIELKTLAKNAAQTLERRDGDPARIAALEGLLGELVDDHDFWNHQARSLAVFATPERLRCFRLPNALERELQVSDRFALAPLLRVRTFPNAACVLVLAEGRARLVEVSADRPAATVAIPELPQSADEYATEPLADRMPRFRAQGTLGDASPLRKMARAVNGLVHDRLRGSGLPLVLAAAEPMTSIFRAANTYPHLIDAVIEDAQSLGDTALAQRVRPILDELYRDDVERWRERFADHLHRGLGATDLASVARAATAGAVESLMVDMTRQVEGSLGESDGALLLGDEAGPESYDVLGEVAARVTRTGGRVLAVRADDMPDGAQTAAILRYPM